MNLRSPIAAILWETWRLTRAEAAWKLAISVVGGFAVLALCAGVAVADDAARYEAIMDIGAAIAMTLLVLPHVVSCLALAKLNGGRPGFPFYLHYSRPVRTAIIVGIPMAYLTAMSSAIYLVSALLLRSISGYAFPLLPVAAWMAALTLISTAATWSTRDRAIQVLVMMLAIAKAWGLAMERLTAVELPGGYDWPPRLWPTLFDFPLTDYAWIALIGLASFAVTVAMVRRQRRGDQLVPPRVRAIIAAITGVPRDGLWVWLIDVFRFPCPTSSPTRAQVWLDLKSNGLPVLTLGVALAGTILLLSAVGGPIDAAINANHRVSCPIKECFYARAFPPLFTPLALLTVLFLGGNAFGIRRRQGRTYISAFDATTAYGTARLAAHKLIVKSTCLLAASIALVASVWTSFLILGDEVFLQMWNVPLSSRLRAIQDAAAALMTYEQLALAVVAVIAVIVWVATSAALTALWTRYARRMNIAATSLLLFGLALALFALAQRNGTASAFLMGALIAATRWIAAAALVSTTVYVFWSGFAERLLTTRYAWGVVLISASFGAAWVTVLHALGLDLTAISTADGAGYLWPVLLPPMIGALAPLSLNRIRHT